MVKNANHLKYKVNAGKALPPTTVGVRTIYKEPLIKVENGFGYKGCVTRSYDNKFVQCHICGYFLSNLPIHVRKTHNMSSREYKQKFSLNLTTSLLSGDERNLRRKSFFEMSEEDIKKAKENTTNNRAKIRNPGKRVTSLEEVNKRGTCPDQLLDKLEKLHRKLGKVPTLNQFMKHYKMGQYSILREFGSWKEFVKVAGLVQYKKIEVKYE